MMPPKIEKYFSVAILESCYLHQSRIRVYCSAPSPNAIESQDYTFHYLFPNVCL